MEKGTEHRLGPSRCFSGQSAVDAGQLPDALRQLRCQLARQHPPLPVAGLSPRLVGAVSRPQLQIVLHLSYKQLGHRAHAAPDDTPIEALLVIKTQILLGKGNIRRICLLPP